MISTYYAVRVLLLVLLIPLWLSWAASAADRSGIPEAETWDLSILYPSLDAWSAEKKEIAAALPKIQAYKGHLVESAESLFEGLDLISNLRKRFSWLRSYASQLSDLDVRDAKSMEMKQSLTTLGSDFAAATSWVEPELLQLPKEKIASFMEAEKRLEIYRPVIDEIFRKKEHTLSPAEEKIMANAILVTGTAGSAYGLFSDAEIPRATVTLADGESVLLDASAYTYYRAVPNRWDRELVFQAFFGNLNRFKGTFGALLNGEVKKNMFVTKARHYESCLAWALDDPNIPVEVYHTLIRNVHQNLPTLWRYLKLRERIMGVEDLRYSDLYASIIKEVDMDFSVEEAKRLVIKGVAPLGEDYVAVLGEGFENRWVDWHPTPGKRSGAYSSGSAYGAHPFILMNFTGTYEEVSTLAHEAGHAMHSYYSNKHQPYPTSDYTIFVAEVASTCNEHLLMDTMLKNTDDDDVKLFLLGSQLDNFRQTLFRQTQFAEFELKIHRMAEEGMALTGENLNKAYAEVIDAYYGVKEGITEINPVCYAEWAYIPHFYYTFYVFTYATSITASTAISQMILENRPGAVDRYLKFLGMGNSRPPVEELRAAGVDMTTDEPFNLTMKAMNRTMDQIEEILDRKGL